MAVLITPASISKVRSGDRELTNVAIREVGQYTVPVAILGVPAFRSALEVVRISAYRDGLVLLEALDNVVSTELLSESVRLEIRPKIETSDLNFLLAWSSHPSEALRGQILPVSFREGTGIYETFVGRFLAATEEVLRHGVIPRIVPRMILNDSVIGDVDAVRSTEHLWTSGEVAFYQEVPILDLSHPATRVLITALQQVARAGASVLGADIVRHGHDLLELLPEVEPFWNMSEAICALRSILDSPALDPARAYYLPALRAAEPILEAVHRQQGSDRCRDDFALRISMPLTFESAVRNMTAAGAGRRASVAKEADHFLYQSSTDMAAFNPTMEPDIVVRPTSDRLKCLAILDAKYKDRPSAADHYQMAAYLESLNADFGVFVTMADDGEPSGLRSEAMMQDGRYVAEYALRAGDLKTATIEYIAWISAVVKDLSISKAA